MQEAQRNHEDSEVLSRPERRKFSAAYKLGILEEADRCSNPGEVGSLLRREGLYASHLSSWRRARDKGALSSLSRKRGPKPQRNEAEKEVERLRRENTRLRKELDRAKTIIGIQKKVSEMMGIELKDPESGEND